MQSGKSHKWGLLEEQEKGAQKAVEKFDRSERSSTPAAENPACKIWENTKKRARPSLRGENSCSFGYWAAKGCIFTA